MRAPAAPDLLGQIDVEGMKQGVERGFASDFEVDHAEPLPLWDVGGRGPGIR
jgi:hypothetical protein